MNNDAKKIVPLISVAVALIVASGSAIAADYSGKIRAGIGISDNISRSAGPEVEETIATAGFDLGVASQQRTTDFELRVNFDYLDYLDDTFDAEWVGGINGNATFTLVEERLRWIVQDNFGQQLLNPFQAETPGNRENVNYFSTGPTINLLPAGRNSIVVDARFDRVGYEDRPADNDRLSGTLSFGRSLSRGRELSVNFVGRRVEYDESQLAPPWEGLAAFVQFMTQGGRNTLSIDAGFNRVEYADVESDGVLLNISWSRMTSPHGSLEVSGGSRYSDQGDLFRQLQSGSARPGDTADLSATTAPFLNNYLRLGYSLRHDRYSILANINLNQEDYEESSDLDRDLYAGTLSLRRDVTRTVFAGARVHFARRDYKDADRRDDDLTLGLDLGYKFGAGMDMSLDYEHFQRNSTIAGADFAENRAFLRLTYTPLWSRKTAR